MSEEFERQGDYGKVAEIRYGKTVAVEARSRDRLKFLESSLERRKKSEIADRGDGIDDQLKLAIYGIHLGVFSGEYDIIGTQATPVAEAPVGD